MALPVEAHSGSRWQAGRQRDTAGGRMGGPAASGGIHRSGAAMGAGGIAVFDDRTAPATLRLDEYNAAEACGECAPCREGRRALLPRGAA